MASASPAARYGCRAMYDQTVRIAIVPSWMRFYDSGTGRLPKFLKELAERKGALSY